MAHFGHRQPSVTNPFSHTKIMQTEINEPKEGDYFSIRKDGEDWPILICDEEMTRMFPIRSPRPESARQADGTWGNGYKAGGFLISNRLYPAIYLATLDFIWAPTKELEPIDIDLGRAIRDSTTNPLLARAWTEYIGQFRGGKLSEWKYLDHWKAKLLAQRLGKTTPGGSKKEKLHGKMPGECKRKETPKPRYPPCYNYEVSDDEESDDLFLPKTNSSGPKIKREFDSSISSEEMDALYEDADPPYPTYFQSNKRSRIDPSRRSSMRPSTPMKTNSSRPATRMPSPVRHGTPLQFTNKKIDVNDPNTVVIYVDNPHKRFVVERTGLDASPFLSKLVTYHPENGWYIMSPLLSSLDANDFQAIGEYIVRREYHPNILDDGTAHVRLEGDPTPELLRSQVVRCGTIYQIAQTLEMPGLQALAFRKLKALEPYHQPLDLLSVIDALYDIGSLELRRYLTQHVADHFWHFVHAEREMMAEVMQAKEGLAKGVFWIMSEREGEVGLVKEEGVKEEEEEGHVQVRDKGGFEELKIEGRGEGGVAEVGANHQTSKEVNDGAHLHAVVEDAQRQSEEDWVRLVPEESAVFEAF